MKYILQNLSVCLLKEQKEALQRTSFQDNVGVHGWIGPFDIVFVAYCCGIFVPVSFVFSITCNFFSDRGFKCRLRNVVQSYFLDIILTLCCSVKILKTRSNQYRNGLKTPRVQAVYIFLLRWKCTWHNLVTRLKARKISRFVDNNVP